MHGEEALAAISALTRLTLSAWKLRGRPARAAP
jgi:hypothetical protein